MLQNSIDSFVFDSSRLKIIDQIGEGGQAVVYLVEDDENNQFAAKVLKSDVKDIEHQVEKNFIRELTILCKVNNPCTIGLKGYTFSPKFLEDEKQSSGPTLILEKASGGSISTMIDSPDPKWTPTKRMISLIGTAYGMKCLHSMHIIHRDLKS